MGDFFVSQLKIMLIFQERTSLYGNRNYQDYTSVYCYFIALVSGAWPVTERKNNLSTNLKVPCVKTK